MRPGLFGGALLLLAVAVGDVAAQTSIYGVRGLGFPGREASSRERALGSGFLALDPGSPVNPAAVAGFGSVTVQIMAETNLRSYSVDTVDVDGLSSTRFPLALLGGRVGSTPLSFGLSFAQYTERSYDLTYADTVELRGQQVAFEERTTSRGGITDVRGALGYRLSTKLWVGAGFHMLTGSAKLSFLRAFADSAYRPYRIETEESITGLGASAGVIFVPGARVALGLSVRSDTRADVKVDSVTAANVDLPVTIVGGVRLVPIAPLRWVTSVVWRSWSTADDDLVARAFDTWEVGSGLEIGGLDAGTRIPIRLGFRYATLPFSPTDEQPHEIDLALGLGVVFAASRGLVDLAVERVVRTGPGSDERGWQLSWTVTVRP